MEDVLVLQNSKIEDPGTFGKLLEADGFSLRTVYTKKEQIPSGNYSLLLVLGANQSANDNLNYLVQEQEIIKKFVKNNIPVLGICLGSQLIAKAFGGIVSPGPKKEIGFFDDIEIDNNSRLFSGINTPMTVFHWHGDTFTLPPNSIRIAHSQIYENQAFQLGSAVALQFHLEVDKETVRLWLEKAADKLKEISYIRPNRILQEIDEKIPFVQNNMEVFYKNFKSIFQL